jgi:hypothetical protein
MCFIPKVFYSLLHITSWSQLNLPNGVSFKLLCASQIAQTNYTGIYANRVDWIAWQFSPFSPFESSSWQFSPFEFSSLQIFLHAPWE